MLRIGDFSKLSQVSVKALRFYDEIGLLEPTYVDQETGYRYYAPGLLSRLNRILTFKELGFSLEEIALLLRDDLPADQVREALRSKRNDLSRRIAREQARLAQVEDWLAEIELRGNVPNYEVVLRPTVPQLVASIRERLTSYEEAEELFAQLRRYLEKHGAWHQPPRQAAVWHACASQAGQIECEAMIPLNAPIPAGKGINVYELPTSLTVCLVHQGSDETIARAYAAAHSWAGTNGYQIAGPLCEIYWQGGVASGRASGVTEIQYPVLKLKTPVPTGH